MKDLRFYYKLLHQAGQADIWQMRIEQKADPVIIFVVSEENFSAVSVLSRRRDSPLEVNDHDRHQNHWPHARSYTQNKA